MDHEEKKESIFWDQYLTTEAFSDFLDKQDLSPQAKLKAYHEFSALLKNLKLNNHQEQRGIYDIVSKWTLEQIEAKADGMEKQIMKQKIRYFIFPKLVFLLGLTLGTLLVITLHVKLS
mgnify:FL=1